MLIMAGNVIQHEGLLHHEDLFHLEGLLLHTYYHDRRQVIVTADYSE